MLSDAAIAFQLDITSCPHEHVNGLALLIEELPKKNREFQLHPLPGSAVYYPFDSKGATNETLQACMVTQSLVVMGFGFQCLSFAFLCVLVKAVGSMLCSLALDLDAGFGPSSFK